MNSMFYFLVLGGFSGGICVFENIVLFLKYFFKRLFIREFKFFFFVLCCKYNLIQEIELEEMLRNKNQQNR